MTRVTGVSLTAGAGALLAVTAGPLALTGGLVGIQGSLGTVWALRNPVAVDA